MISKLTRHQSRVPASFDISQYDILPDQQCEAGRFWKCINTGTTAHPFFGCCKSDPCETGTCPADDLAAAFLSNQPASYAVFESDPSTTTGPSPSMSSGSHAISKSARTNETHIVVGVVVGLLVLAVIGIIGMYLLRRRRRHKLAKGTIISNIDPARSSADMQRSTSVLPVQGTGPSKAFPSPMTSYELDATTQEMGRSELDVVDGQNK